MRRRRNQLVLDFAADYRPAGPVIHAEHSAACRVCPLSIPRGSRMIPVIDHAGLFPDGWAHISCIDRLNGNPVAA